MYLILLFQQTSLLLFNFGIKLTLKFVTRWPALVILPCFSPFAFSGEVHNSKKVLVVSRNWTFVNMVLNLICATSGIFALFAHNGPGSLVVTPIVSLPVLGFSLILIIITYCSNRCCTITQRTGCLINNDDTLDLMDLDPTKENPEAQEMQAIENINEL